MGVVIFVLALTILGLSLFSLSSFEAQFLGRSARNTQTLYDAMSGIEWAKMVLAREKTLESVQNGHAAEPTRPSGVTRVTAWQDEDSTGAINYASGVAVRIRALADDGRGERRMVEAEFTPVIPDDTYRNLIDSHEYVRIPEFGGAPPVLRRPRMFLYGNVRLNDNTDPDWELAPGVHTATQGGVALPNIGPSSAYWNSRWNTATELQEQPGSSGQYTMTAGSTPTYFKTSSNGGPNSIYEDHPNPQVHVSGTCVWMVDKGMRFNAHVNVYGTSSARLIIVARELYSSPYDPPPANYGIDFYSGIHSPNVPIVLVSNSEIRIEYSQGTTDIGIVNAISIFGRSVFLLGPEATSVWRQELRHDASMDAVIDELAQESVLPNLTSGTSAAFLRNRGTWRELDPDYPS